ncbi:hypothetical protein MUN82_08695 [Hymenobacter aerilatus]|uniref:Uncharacterized protein n=1 Tax=Hymenobacter aerilatus TaxID=2932251 RepID=A0A8T9T3J3_9BACT|nr:hypothetical protein [Hymenobacter aerilatus]UOR07160.1 hypothetical protein MUN82_08695 [Hymenobacter aerilatus]
MAYAAQAGLRPWEFWRMTWPDYEHAVLGYQNKQEQEIRRLRELGAWVFQANGTKTKTGKEIQGAMLWPLPTDRATSEKTESNDAFLKRMAAMNYFKRPTTT